MESLFILVPLSVALVFLAAYLFLKMSDAGQFDDAIGPALRVLQDDDSPEAHAGPLDENHKN